MQGRRIALWVVMAVAVVAVIDLWLGPVRHGKGLFGTGASLDELVRTTDQGLGPGGARGDIGAHVPHASRTGSVRTGAFGGESVRGVRLDRLELANGMGEVTVRGWNREEVVDDYEIVVYADSEDEAARYLERLSVTTVVEGSALAIRLDEANSQRGPAIRGVAVNHRIQVPERFAARLENAFGDIEVSGIAGDLRASNAYGAMVLRSIGGRLVASNRFGSIDVEGVGGSAEVNVAYEGGSISRVRGDLDLTGRFAGLDVGGVMGDVVASVEYGTLGLTSVGGGARIDSRFTPVETSGIAGPLVLRASYGRARLSGLVSDVSVDSRFSPLELETSPGVGCRLDVECRRGHVLGVPQGLRRTSDRDTEKVSGIVGDGRISAAVTSEFADVTLRLSGR